MIYAVIVLYKKSLNQSTTFMSLSTISDMYVKSKLHVLVYANHMIDKVQDTYKQAGVTDHGFASFEFVVSHDNRGIAIPYNLAHLKAKRLGCNWLLLLDQDSLVEEEYMKSMLESALSVKSTDVAAIVPKILVANRLRAPRVGFFGAVLTDDNDRRMQGRYLTTINSGALISIDFLNQINGFDEKYWLDGLDTWLFVKIYQMNKAIIIKRTLLHHDLSLAGKNYVTPDRLMNIVRSEIQLWDEFRYWPFRFKLGVGIAKRVIRLILHGRWKHLRAMTTLLKTKSTAI